MKKIISKINRLMYLFYRKKHMLVGFSLGWLVFVVVSYDMSFKIFVNLSIILLVLLFHCILDIVYRGVKK